LGFGIVENCIGFVVDFGHQIAIGIRGGFSSELFHQLVFFLLVDGIVSKLVPVVLFLFTGTLERSIDLGEFHDFVVVFGTQVFDLASTVDGSSILGFWLLLLLLPLVHIVHDPVVVVSHQLVDFAGVELVTTSHTATLALSSREFGNSRSVVL